MTSTREWPEFCVNGASVKSLASVLQIGGSQVVTALEKSTSFFNTSRKTYRHVYVFNDVKLNGRFRCKPATVSGVSRFQ
jgi:hypothetical protein